LYSHKPGDEVAVVVLRNGERVSLTVKLGKRGG
jgi:S1-C subfamily serine protease